MEIKSELLTGDTWEDFESLFLKHKGVRGGCWCTFHQCPSGQFNKMSPEERKNFHKDRVLDKISTGLIYYIKDIPVAWCQFGPADAFEQINRNRAYKKLGIESDMKPDWRICCIFVDKDFRGRGLSQKVLAETILKIQGLGGGIIEAFPLDIKGIAKPSYTGSVNMYSQEGFRKVARLGKNIVLMRKTV